MYLNTQCRSPSIEGVRGCLGAAADERSRHSSCLIQTQRVTAAACPVQQEACMQGPRALSRSVTNTN